MTDDNNIHKKYLYTMCITLGDFGDLQKLREITLCLKIWKRLYFDDMHNGMNIKDLMETAKELLEDAERLLKPQESEPQSNSTEH